VGGGAGAAVTSAWVCPTSTLTSKGAPVELLLLSLIVAVTMITAAYDAAKRAQLPAT
jgi:hypothetical protein